jgi:hypothetical protein
MQHALFVTLMLLLIWVGMFFFFSVSIP